MSLASINSAINGFVWGPIMLLLLVGCGVLLSFRTGFIQVSKFKTWWNATIVSIFKDKSVHDKSDKSSLSQFQAFTTALAATVGTGNIAGVATAIVAGGPGAVFWMWVSAFFGMCTKYAEALLAVLFRYKAPDGSWMGGAMVYLQKGVKGGLGKFLAGFFCVLTALAAFGIGNMTQVNSIAGSITRLFPVVPGWVVGVILVLLVGLVLIGGLKRIGAVTEKLVPVMALFYVVGGLITIVANASHLGRAFSQIFSQAFSFRAVGGGVAGVVMMRAMRFGVARGVFSNEAGLGSASMAHATANVKEPVKQGLWGVFEVFADTIIVCSITALAILTSFDGMAIADVGLNGAQLSMAAFGTIFGTVGEATVAIALCMFAFSTLISWSYYGNRSATFLFGDKASKVYNIIFTLVVFGGSIGGLELIWDIADTLNGLMAIPNLIGLVCLSGVVAKATKDYFQRRKDANYVEINRTYTDFM
ncbi:MAG: sodium:alanine symporter family protein [Clostridia bacterium]|nr:sodium:alanine symporter family protein [Clostridia bacterium]